MTNAIDVLLVGGPRNSTVVCMNRARMTTNIEFPEGDVYTRQVWTDPDTTLQYHVAVIPELELGDVDISAEVAQSRFPPAWDLR